MGEDFIHPRDLLGNVEVTEYSASNFQTALSSVINQAKRMVSQCSDENPPFFLAIIGTMEGQHGGTYIKTSSQDAKVNKLLMTELHNYIHAHRMESKPAEIHPENLKRNVLLPDDLVDREAVKVYD